MIDRTGQDQAPTFPSGRPEPEFYSPRQMRIPLSVLPPAAVSLSESSNREVQMCSKKPFVLALVAIGATWIGPIASADAKTGVNCPPSGYIISHGFRHACRSSLEVDPKRLPKGRPLVANPSGGGNVINTGASGPTHMQGGGRRR
jgi:hypothetical protein